MRRMRGEDGQASVELVALLPVIAAVVLACWQGVVAGQAWWLAAVAARAAARAQLVGADPARAARAALPGRQGARVRLREEHGRLVVRLPVTAVVGRVRIGEASATVRPGES
jgi:Flp pilus assembly pilin Flp